MGPLESRWMSFVGGLGGEATVAEAAFGQLVAAYGSKARHYHSLVHIEACLDVMGRHVPRDGDANHVEMAIWWHDFVYDPMRSDNELRSAAKMQKACQAMGLDETFVAEVADMIPYTRHDATLEAMPNRYKVLVDVDLSILGASEDVFDEYERAVRKEYAFVPEETFTAGRAKILEQFLARPSLYETATFRGVFEKAARANLERSLVALETAGHAKRP